MLQENNPMKRLLLLCVALSLCSCATFKPPATQLQIPALIQQLSVIDSLTWLQGYGTLQVSARGQKAKLSIETVWNGDNDCTITLYAMFGITVASLTTDSTGRITVHAMKKEEVRYPDDTIDIGIKLFDYPFTYRDFMHILTGKLLNSSFISTPCDSLSILENDAHMQWNSPLHTGGDYNVSAEINRMQSRINKVRYSAPGAKGWQLDYALFNDILPQEIRFEDANNNYFNLTYDKISCGVTRCH